MAAFGRAPMICLTTWPFWKPRPHQAHTVLSNAEFSTAAGSRRRNGTSPWNARQRSLTQARLDDMCLQGEMSGYRHDRCQTFSLTKKGQQ
jgi:hypothetical protein